MNLLTKFHEDRTINVDSREKCPAPWQPCFSSKLLTRKTAPPPGGNVFSPIWTIFELFHDDWAKIMTSRVFTRNTAPPCGGHTNILTKLHEDWELIFVLNRVINGTNVLTKFHEDHTINVASRVFTRQNVDNAQRTTHNGQKAITKTHHEHVVLR
ncbi:hypothetical protein DPMN_011488 [Dreissena polymorpha]|uniref:Uncharacterized protein n=1 Tax=Dreissena polymorpha TaxID=45954 RepID=A0A9D4N441_DREPO|nr:hypothetical protein DPMN_011488 [Dreissena polymorpha]